MILRIDTSDQKKVKVALLDGEKVVKQMSEENQYGSQVLLPLINKLVDVKKLTSIEVATGPGSFTGLRVGASVANALAFSLGIPVNGKKQELDLVY